MGAAGPGGRPPASAGDVLAFALDRHPSREALVSVDARLSYEALDQAVERAAGALWEVGIREDDVVAVSLPNKSAVVVTFHALMRLGAIWLGVNQNLAPPEKAFMLRDAGARFILADAKVIESLALGSQRDGAPPVSVVTIGTDDWASMTSGAPAKYLRSNRTRSDAAAIAYTSGTTGRPKGVIHSHENLLLPGAMLVQARRFGPELRKGDCAALTILNMQVTSTLLVAQAGGTQIVMDRTDPLGVASWIRTEAVTSWFGVPTTLQGMADSTEIRVKDLRSLNDIWTGGAFCPEATRDAFTARFGHRIYATYGLTEVPTIATIEDREGTHCPDSSGQALPHLSVEVCDDHGNVLPPGTVGEITVRARDEGLWAHQYHPMLGYLGHPDETAEAIRDGALRTGDIGHLDGFGNLFVHDRRNTLILRGGANIYPAEVERVLLEVAEIDGACVIGLPDERLGQQVAAAIESRPGARLDLEEIRKYCLSQLARYKVPERWHIGPLPRNAMGKVMRTEVLRYLTDPAGNALHQAGSGKDNHE
jgi:long-chain acyl-CoA synthetase